MAGRSFACTNCGQPFTLSLGGEAFAPPAVSYASAATHAKSNPLAMASLICGCILCVPFVPGIAAIVTGAIGMRKTRDPAVTGKGLAIAGLVLGILNVLGWGAYFGLIFAIMVPTMGMAKQSGNQMKCSANLKQIGLAIQLYANEHRGRYPDSLGDVMRTQDIDRTAFVCPATSHTIQPGSNEAVAIEIDAGEGSYAYVGKGMKTPVGAKTVVAYEPLSNHGAGSNVLFGDGSVQFILAGQAEQMIKQIEAGRNPPDSNAMTQPAVEAGP
jgi:prepilin-type processing-associated H-X9-DG protein